MRFSKLLSIISLFFLGSILRADFSAASMSSYLTGNCNPLCHVEIDWNARTYQLKNWGSEGRDFSKVGFEFAVHDGAFGIRLMPGTYVYSHTFYSLEADQRLVHRSGSTAIRSQWVLQSGGIPSSGGSSIKERLDGDWKFDPPLEICGENCVMRIDSEKKIIKRVYLDGSQSEYDFPIFDIRAIGPAQSEVVFINQDIYKEVPYDLMCFNERITFPDKILPDLIRISR